MNAKPAEYLWPYTDVMLTSDEWARLEDLMSAVVAAMAAIAARKRWTLEREPKSGGVLLAHRRGITRWFVSASLVPDDEPARFADASTAALTVSAVRYIPWITYKLTSYREIATWDERALRDHERIQSDVARAIELAEREMR